MAQVSSGGESGNESGEWWERGDHPMLNVLILEMMFGFVRRCDLKSCREVCKKWNLLSIPRMRATLKVTIHGCESIFPANDARRIGDFVKLFSSNEFGIPFAKFQLGPFCMTDGVGKQFLEICGETATEIDLNERVAYTIDDVSELLRASPNLHVFTLPHNLISRSQVKLFTDDSIPTLPSLEKITFRRDCQRNGLKFRPTFIQNFLTAAPNISDIVVFDNFHANATGIDEVLNAIERLGVESSIQSLRLDGAKIVHIEQLRRMAEKEIGLKLKNLCLSLGKERSSRDAINAVQIQLATCFRDSLQHFCVKEGVNNNLMEFPYMPNLKSLTFRTLPDLDPKSVNLNRNFPVLETFTFYQNNNLVDWSLSFSKFECCPTLKSLNVFNYMKIRTFHDILSVFPNLIKLNLSVQDDGAEILREIWSHMSRLESLTIHGSIESKKDLHLDSLFTGIPSEVLKGIRHVVKDLEKMTVHERRETILNIRSNHREMPSIGNLTKLRHLELEVCGRGNFREGHLSDLTAYLAFFCMHRLNHLNVRRCEFTKTSCEILRKETGLETCGFQNMKYENIIPPFLLL